VSAPSREDELAQLLVETTAELNAVIDLAEQLGGQIVPLLDLVKDWPLQQRRRLSTTAITLRDWSLGARHQTGERARARLLASEGPDRSLF
jgi:hypothetical protein